MDAVTWLIIRIWLELTAIVIFAIAGFLFIGYRIRMSRVLHWLRVQFLIHYIVTEKRLESGIVLEKELETYGGFRYIPYKGFKYRIRREKIFFDGYDLGVAHKMNVIEPLDISDVTLFASDPKITGAVSAQETDGAINSKVVSDLNKSMYTTKDTIMLIAIAFVGVFEAINVYINYENSQSIATVIKYLAKISGVAP